MSNIYTSDIPVAPLGLGKHRHQLLYTFRLSEALANRIIAPAVRKVCKQWNNNKYQKKRIYHLKLRLMAVA
ncbi:MAG: hypothetical protein OXD54_00645 [Candidatus Poribacteria bacterium]|nr:hypothetical protein [Candidatus Poribacteria bacterium]